MIFSSCFSMIFCTFLRGVGIGRLLFMSSLNSTGGGMIFSSKFCTICFTFAFGVCVGIFSVSCFLLRRFKTVFFINKLNFFPSNLFSLIIFFYHILKF